MRKGYQQRLLAVQRRSAMLVTAGSINDKHRSLLSLFKFGVNCHCRFAPFTGTRSETSCLQLLSRDLPLPIAALQRNLQRKSA